MIGKLLKINSDQGMKFPSSVFKGLCQLCGVEKTQTTSCGVEKTQTSIHSRAACWRSLIWPPWTTSVLPFRATSKIGIRRCPSYCWLNVVLSTRLPDKHPPKSYYSGNWDFLAIFNLVVRKTSQKKQSGISNTIKLGKPIQRLIDWMMSSCNQEHLFVRKQRFHYDPLDHLLQLKFMVLFN